MPCIIVTALYSYIPWEEKYCRLKNMLSEITATFISWFKEVAHFSL